jgi:hypothetical protein
VSGGKFRRRTDIDKLGLQRRIIAKLRDCNESGQNSPL